VAISTVMECDPETFSLSGGLMRPPIIGSDYTGSILAGSATRPIRRVALRLARPGDKNGADSGGFQGNEHRLIAAAARAIETVVFEILSITPAQ
jgi:hypothetical protein